MNEPPRPPVAEDAPPRTCPPMPDDATIRALEAYFAKLAAVDPADEPAWSVEDLFPPDP